ncbi:MAG: cob(I)yrinic acid a,c-diamide adenosyltransferase [Planctomycetota bacterium]|jgi:cob(I)alamin adenosyltransferase
MVHLSKIYTKSGDKGETGLGDGTRVPKTDLRVEAYGTVDEANSVLGVACLHIEDGVLLQLIRGIQNDLFDVGADLASPMAEDEQPGTKLRITSSQVKSLELAIDQWNERLEPLQSFVLPGGSAAAAWFHLARTVVRRAERLAVAAQREAGPVNEQAVIYLNRLSDLCFVLARIANNDGKDDVLWSPGLTQRETKELPKRGGQKLPDTRKQD